MRRAAMLATIAGLMALAQPALDACAASGRCVSAPVGDWPSAISLGGMWKYHAASLIAADAYRPDLNDHEWPEMRVPSNWFQEGLDRSGAVWFRRTFALPAGAGARTLLVFEGVDYTADVWLNGHYLGFHEGYFDRFSFAAAPWLRTGGPNVLAVRVESPLEQGPSWSLHKRLIKGVFGHHDARPGNAWSDRGQEQNTGGIWGGVWIKLAGDVSLDVIHVRPDAVTPSGAALEDGHTARLTASVTVNNATAESRRLRIRATVSPSNFLPSARSSATITQTLQVGAGASGTVINLDVPAAQRWWTWEHGQPNLYRLDVELLDGDTVVDAGSRVFGFRTVSLNSTTGEWRLNGRRIFLRGTNYIASQWLSEMTPAAYRRDLALMRQAGVNAIRVHAHVEGEELYRRADEDGLLIWQDFPLQWGYVDDLAFRTEAVRQATAMIDQLDHHPSIVAWSAHNEPPWDATWMKDKYPDYTPDQNRELDRALAVAMAARDGSRHVHAASTTLEHPWFGWYSGTMADYAKPATQPLITEYGAQALPDLASLRRFIPERELWPADESGWATWTYHDFQPRETFAHVARGASTAELIDNTQRYQAQLIQFAAEAYRRQKYAPVGAIFQFMFNECWPSANWGVVDYWRRPKPGYAALTTAYQPVLPSIAWTPGRLRAGVPVRVDLWVVNDLFDRFARASLEWTVRSSQVVLDSGRTELDIAGDSAENVMPLAMPLGAGQYELLVSLRDAKGRPLGTNAWTFTVEAQP